MTAMSRKLYRLVATAIFEERREAVIMHDGDSRVDRLEALENLTNRLANEF